MLTLLAAAFAADLPSIDQPLATGVNNTTDAAVVVGVGDYLRVEDVPYAEADARAFAAFATTTLGIPGSRIWQPRNKNKEAIEEAVAQAGAKVRAGGTVWVYFAGHGAADPRTKERLLLGDDVTDDANFTARSVSVAKVEALAGASGGRVVVLSDVCYTGQFRSLVLDPPKPKGEVIEWSAAQQGQVAAPLAGTGHGAFTWMVLGAFRGWADGEPEVEGAARNKADGVVTAREARDYVERQLAAMQLRGQVPEMVAGSAGLESARLVSGVREAAPVLGVAGTTGAHPQPPEDDYSAKLAALKRAQSDADAASAAHESRVSQAVAKKQAEAKAAWVDTKGIVAAGGSAGKAAAELYVTSFGAASVVVDGERRSVEIPEVAEAEAVLKEVPTTAGSAEAASGLRPDEIAFALIETQLEKGNEVSARHVAHQFIDANPKHDRVAEAYYRIAESYQNAGDYADAAAAFEYVVANFESSVWVPWSLLRRGESLESLGNIAEAKRAYCEVVKRFPKAKAVTFAKPKC